MAFKMFSGASNAVTARTISGHATGYTLPAAQNAAAKTRIGDPSSAQGRVLASRQPNTDRRRFVTH